MAQIPQAATRFKGDKNLIPQAEVIGIVDDARRVSGVEYRRTKKDLQKKVGDLYKVVEDLADITTEHGTKGNMKKFRYYMKQSRMYNEALDNAILNLKTFHKHGRL